jgi:hypothetical protein
VIYISIRTGSKSSKEKRLPGIRKRGKWFWVGKNEIYLNCQEILGVKMTSHL